MPDRLYRSRRERMIGGVAGGIAESLHIDPTIVRIAWIVLALATNGLLVLVYFLLLFLLPEAPDGEPEGPASASETGSGAGGTAAASSARATSTAISPSRASERSSDGRTGALVAGAILVLVGGYFLVRDYLPSIDLRVSWPFIAVGLGIVLIVASLRPGRR